jgi:hypothetical protein
MVWIALLGACGHAPRGESLLDAARTYNDGVRWERFAAAAVAIPPAEREAFLDERDELAEDLRITDCEVVRVKDEGDSATIQVKLNWYLESEGIAHDTWAKQTWEHHGKSWRIVAEERVRGDAMPGLPDRLPDGTDPLEVAADR